MSDVFDNNGKHTDVSAAYSASIESLELELEEAQNRIKELEAELEKFKEPVEEIPQFKGTLDDLSLLDIKI